MPSMTIYIYSLNLHEKFQSIFWPQQWIGSMIRKRERLKKEPQLWCHKRVESISILVCVLKCVELHGEVLVAGGWKKVWAAAHWEGCCWAEEELELTSFYVGGAAAQLQWTGEWAAAAAATARYLQSINCVLGWQLPAGKCISWPIYPRLSSGHLLPTHPNLKHNLKY